MINCKIISETKLESYTNILSIRVPSLKGAIEILSNHPEMFLILKQGNVILKNFENSNNIQKISGGYLHVINNEISIVIE